MEAIVAVVIFVLMFALIILDKIPRHWITVILDGSMTDEEVLPLITDSWALTAPKGRLKREETR